MDGIDAAFVTTDGNADVLCGPAFTLPYDRALRDRLRAVLGGVGDVEGVERALTLSHAAAVERLVRADALEPDLIGFHGHTILHDPGARRTWQLGDGALLAELTGIDVVCDFRSADVAAGGEGAPLVPLFHQALAQALERPLAVLNIGGVANVTWIGAGEELLAFDTGPGNALLDDWMLRHTGRAFDADGALAASGRADEAAVARFLEHPYFARPAPKSLDRDAFRLFHPDGLGAADGAATLAAMTAAAVASAARHFPAPARRWIVTGGGRHNPVLMQSIAARLGGASLVPGEAVGWDGDALEAQAFAYLAVRSRQGLPLSLPATTGVPAPTTGGRFFPAAKARPCPT